MHKPSLLHPFGSKRLPASLAALACAALLAACAGAPQQNNPPPHAERPSMPSSTGDKQAQEVLGQYFWDLQSAVDGRDKPSAEWALDGRKPLRLVFQGDRVNVENLCNVLGAGYSVEGPRLQITRGMSTLRACAEPGLMALEQRVGQLLPQAQTYALRHASAPGQKPRLTIAFSNGVRWELAGVETPATRYGSAGERVFLEVDAQRVRCNHPLMPPSTECLRVREIRYDERGIKSGMGEWRVMQGGIEGYQHEAGIRNVLRLQRYSLARNGQLPADAPSHAYVLDMVVESERVR
jgi:heat shock protein HslJ